MSAPKMIFVRIFSVGKAKRGEKICTRSKIEGPRRNKTKKSATVEADINLIDFICFPRNAAYTIESLRLRSVFIISRR